MKNKLYFTAILLTGLTFLSPGTSQLFGQSAAGNITIRDTILKYTCPRHPDFVSDKPGKCACGMELVAMKGKDKMSDKSKMNKDDMMNDSKMMKNDKMMKDDKMKMKNDSTGMKKKKM